MHIKDFGVEIWMNLYEEDCAWNLAETCVKSLEVKELIELSGEPEEKVLRDILDMKLTYGAIYGSEALREGIAGLYETAKIENIVTTHGAIGANHLVLTALSEPGDRVVSVLPTYQQMYSIPEAVGAEVSILRLRQENGFLPDLKELESLAEGGVKLICINNPNNPTGALMDEAFLEKVVAIARKAGAWLLADEVYRGLNHEGASFTRSVFDLYEKGISTGSMSKTFSLAGLRTGWICAPKELMVAVHRHRDYSTISCGMIDDYLSALALRHKDRIVERNLAIVKHNKRLLADWVAREPRFSWAEPSAGTTAFLKYDLPMDSKTFCEKLLEETGVLLVPGAAMDVEGYLRIGYANAPEIIEEGLRRLSAFAERHAGQ